LNYDDLKYGNCGRYHTKLEIPYFVPVISREYIYNSVITSYTVILNVKIAQVIISVNKYFKRVLVVVCIRLLKLKDLDANEYAAYPVHFSI
jgi:hypothetical protein